MANIGSSIATSRVTLANLVAGAGIVKTVSMALADTEYSHTFPTGIKAFTIRLRDTAILKLAFTAAASGTTYFTLYGSEPFDSIAMDGTSLSVYFQSPSAGQTLEVIEWS
ncbi:hypothetical protein DRQ25_11090 [Candidatus Fermentibacteria bacterium]|nr:MAG: hypothetical protein DRQ25_11090 [Candidatus Fermentibacteria bacterium]